MPEKLYVAKEPTLMVRGVAVFKEFLDVPAQQQLAEDLRAVISKAPLFSPQTPYGKPMSVRMTSAGRFGWFSDRTGYRYIPTHPSGSPWPAIPKSVLTIWDTVSESTRAPDCCLINFYGPEARMGMHQDKDEADFDYPVVSVSLGDEGLFRVGNTKRGGKTESIWLQSGDVVVMGGAARMTYHGIDRIKPDTSTLFSKPGRVNLTLRVVD